MKVRCWNVKRIAVEELNSLLKYLEEEISEFEKERNRLKFGYHSRPVEEKNVVKDILFMYTEIEVWIAKLKEIANAIKDVPNGEQEGLIKAQDYTLFISVLQSAVIGKHENAVGKLEKIYKLDDENQLSKKQISVITEENQKITEKIKEIKNYENDSDFAKKIKSLHEKIEDIQAAIDDIDIDLEPKTPNERFIINEVLSLSSNEISNRLQEQIVDNSKTEENIKKLKDIIDQQTSNEFFQQEVETKRKNVNKLREIYKKLTQNNEKKNVLKDSHSRYKIKILDDIIDRNQGRKSSPLKNYDSNIDTLHEIQDRLARLKGNKTPVPKN